MIPKKIHFIWVGEGPPEWVRALLHRWEKLNPDFDVKLWDEKVLDERYKELYSQITDFCSKSDLLRLSVLRKEGGWYFDCDFVPLRPMENVYKDFDLSLGLFLTRQWTVGPKRIANGIIGVAGDAQAWQVIDEIVEEHANLPLERTSFGPLLTTKVADKCRKTAVLSAVNDFYAIRFNPVGRATDLYEKLLASNFDRQMLYGIFGERIPYAFHLWAGGKYDKPQLDKLVEGEKK